MAQIEVPAWVAELPRDLTEQQFHELWLAQVDPEASPLAKALQGGFCADQPGWIFVAGYQAAIAHTFPGQQLADWSAFAVSEDRSAQDPLPGLTATQADNDITLSGYKTWIATSRFARSLIVSYRQHDATCFHLFQLSCPGIIITHKDNPSLLPNVSQGVAQFAQVPLQRGLGLDATMVNQFGSIEGFFVLVAMLACLRRFVNELNVTQQDLDELVQQAAAIQSAPEGEPLVQFKARCRDVLRQVRNSQLGQQAAWQRDGKLLAGYAR